MPSNDQQHFTIKLTPYDDYNISKNCLPIVNDHREQTNHVLNNFEFVVAAFRRFSINQTHE